MNAARHHTDQADSRETFASVEAKLAAVGHRSPNVQMSSAEARARALTAVNQPANRCGDCPCDGMGGLAAAILLCIGAFTGGFIVFVCMGGLS